MNFQQWIHTSNIQIQYGRLRRATAWEKNWRHDQVRTKDINTIGLPACMFSGLKLGYQLKVTKADIITNM